jgi:hypothetical protein
MAVDVAEHLRTLFRHLREHVRLFWDHAAIHNGTLDQHGVSSVSPAVS